MKVWFWLKAQLRAGPRREVLVEQMRMLRDVVAIFRALRGSQIVIEQVVGDTHAVEQMAGGEIDVWLAQAVTPDVVAHRRIHIVLRGRKKLWVALHLVGERGLSNGKRDVVLRAALLRRWWRWAPCMTRR